MRSRRSCLFSGADSTCISPQLYLLILFSLLTCCKAATTPSSCGIIRNISCPFRLKGDHQKCDHRPFTYELACDKNRTVIYLPHRFDSDDRYYFYVQNINYNNYSVLLVDPGIDKDNSSSLPLYSIPQISYDIYLYLWEDNSQLTFINCAAPAISSRYINITNVTASHRYSYVVVGDLKIFELEDDCKLSKVTWVSSQYWPDNITSDASNFSDIHDGMAYGFHFSWGDIYCSNCMGFCGVNLEKSVYKCKPFSFCDVSNRDLICNIIGKLYDLTIWAVVIIVMAAAAKFVLGMPFVLAFLVYKLRRRHLSMYNNIEDFLQGNNNLMPIRYSYSQVKKITNGFKDKLGEGGFGSVFKGKLRSGILVAVKIMSKSKTTGQDFMNEVATIGRIHHVNVVQLIGFCFEGRKRALIYEFMPNGSLEKYIFPREKEEETVSLSCEKMYEISYKVAAGIDYLHRGCDMRILHFDIKPHNILLDHDFNPKISDFGLAKLYATDDSIVNLTAARGTMGYMAPELFYKNIGGVSFRADVYSFGMLLMEMAGRRKNLNPFVDQISQIYFPLWVFDHLSGGKEIELEDATEEEGKLIKKMIIVALWCIQLKPSDRPSMNRVIEMLEGDVELLVMPPKPFLCPQEVPAEDQEPTPPEATESPSHDSITEVNW